MENDLLIMSSFSCTNLLDKSKFIFKGSLQNRFPLQILFALLTATLDFVLETVIHLWKHKSISRGQRVKCNQSEEEKIKGHSFLVISIFHTTHFKLEKK